MILQTGVQTAAIFYSPGLDWDGVVLVSVSTACSFPTFGRCQEPKGKGVRNGYVSLLIFQMPRDGRKVWKYYHVLLVHFKSLPDTTA